MIVSQQRRSVQIHLLWYFAGLLCLCVGQPPISGPPVMPLPRVTLCSRAALNSSYVAPVIAPDVKIFAMSLALPSANQEILAAAADVSGWTTARWQAAQSTVNSTAAGPLAYYLDLGYQCGGFVTSCKVGGNSFPCCDRVTTISTYYGPCVRLDTASHFQTAPGLRGGLELKLSLDAGNAVKQAGYLLFLDADDFFLNDPIVIPQGKETFVVLETVLKKRIRPAFGPQNCRSSPSPFGPPPTPNVFDPNIFPSPFPTGFGPAVDPSLQFDLCKRQCLAQVVFTVCQCWPLAIVPRLGQNQSGRYCLVSDLNCTEPLLNGGQNIQTSGGNFGPAVVNPLGQCESSCQPPCLELLAAAKNVFSADLNPTYYPASTGVSLIRLFFSSLDFSGTNEVRQCNSKPNC